MNHDHQISILYFDLGNILYRFDADRSYRNLASVLDVEVEPVARIMKDEGLADAYERGELSDDEFVDWLCKGLLVDAPTDCDTLLNAAGDMFTLIEGMPELVEQVANQTRVGLLSNTCHAHFRWICQLGQREMMTRFDPVILSYQAGAMKPDARIYIAAENAAGCDPASILFVDDKVENVAAALRRGWMAEVCQGLCETKAVMSRYGLLR